ncbi:hypothetical protein JMJ77_0013483 [Colletotrichum scovillei]|uniref:Uncharacterized protein n=1 Tax=Colletotrichum scovillei TaxID=1209932 RepID=A0A9P7R8T7_9PEZI|nr:hypothetical protein JMJ77_0013483 [Colletotrichum scovillei]KAG7069785.1 hypothetical protein JMJ76_0003447 [Colletotrichum scovillei]KAG7073697.1 hypothetical protein JMJ78_0014667 [Colletotrichum scovillei]
MWWVARERVGCLKPQVPYLAQ